MENKFDKEIQELFKAYQEQPSANCWDKVSSQLDAMQNIPDASQGSAASSSANSSAFSQFVGSVVGKITIAVTSVAAIGGLSYMIATSGSSDSSQSTMDTSAQVEVLAEDKENKENTVATIAEQPKTSRETQESVIAQQHFAPQEEQQDQKEENTSINSSHSVLESNPMPSHQTEMAQIPESKAESQSKAKEKQETSQQQKLGKQKPEKKETPEKQHIIEDASNTNAENLKEELKKEHRPIDISKIAISNSLTPNGDGYNDYFTIGNIEEYPENSLVVFGRDGKVVYERTNYRNEWNAENVPDGIYLYIFSFAHGEETYMRRGSITVKR